MTATVAGIHLGLDTHGNRPAANTVPDGSIYSCSTHSLIYKSNYAGNSWATWATLTGSGLSDPMTTRGDVIVRNSSNTTARLAVGAAGKILTSDGTDVAWGNGPMTASGDIIYGGASGTPTRLAKGTDGQVLTLASGLPSWAAGGGGGSSRPYLSSITLDATYGDDFTGASLAGKWTQRNSAVHTYQSGGGSWLRMAHASNNSELIYQTAPAGDFEIVVAFSQYVGVTSDNIMAGPMIVDSSGTGVFCTHYWNTNDTFLGLLSTWSYGSAPVHLQMGSLEYMNVHPLWMGLKKASTNYSFRYSHDGYNWSPYSSTSSQSFTVAYIGFGRHLGTATTTISNLDVFNVI